MPSIGILMLILDVSCAVHVIKRGHDHVWLWIILFFPGVGCLAYLAVVVIPDIGRGQTFNKTTQDVKSMLDPKGKLRQYAENLQIADTVTNRINLAEELLKHDMSQEAIKVYVEAMKGPYKDYPQLLCGLAYAYFKAGTYEEAKSTLERLFLNPTHAKRQDERLLYARTLEAMGDVEAANEEYEALCSTYPGPEAKYRYAILLKRHGELERGMNLLQEILTTARRSPRHYSKLHNKWIAQAKREMSDRIALRG